MNYMNFRILFRKIIPQTVRTMGQKRFLVYSSCLKNIGQFKKIALIRFENGTTCLILKRNQRFIGLFPGFSSSDSSEQHGGKTFALTGAHTD